MLNCSQVIVLWLAVLCGGTVRCAQSGPVASCVQDKKEERVDIIDDNGRQLSSELALYKNI